MRRSPADLRRPGLIGTDERTEGLRTMCASSRATTCTTSSMPDLLFRNAP